MSPEPQDADVVNAEILPARLRFMEEQATDRQRTARILQAWYLLVLVAAPAVKLAVPVQLGDRSLGDELAAVLLVVALGLRLWLRYRTPDASWVLARRDLETHRSQAWRRCATGTPDEQDSEACRTVAVTTVPQRWGFYRRFRIDHQIDYFHRRGEFHRRSARRWRVLQAVLTLVALPATIIQAIIVATAPAVGLVTAALAASEAWMQFRRSDYLAAGFADTAARLEGLRGAEPTDDTELTGVVDEVERILELERWTWVALTSIAVLTASPRAAASQLAGRTGS